MGYETVAAKLEAGTPVVLDGGIGTEVLRRTKRWVRNGIEDYPEVIGEIHRDYLAAGCDVIRANTFQIARRTFLNFFHDLDHMRKIGEPGLEHRASELHAAAVGVAREARRSAGAEERVAIAGSISPLNHPFRSDLAPSEEQAEAEHAETAASLAAAGVDLLLLETMNTLREARGALRAALGTGLPVWVSVVPDDQGRTLGGEPLADAATLGEAGAAAVLVNGAPTKHVDGAVPLLSMTTRVPVGAAAIVGRYAPPSWKMDFFPRFVGGEEVSPAAYARSAEVWRESGAAIVGGCQGTTPDHIRAVVTALTREEEPGS